MPSPRATFLKARVSSGLSLMQQKYSTATKNACVKSVSSTTIAAPSPIDAKIVTKSISVPSPGIPTVYQSRRALEMREQQENKEKEEHKLELGTTDVDGVSTEAVTKLLGETTLTTTTTPTTPPTSQSPPPLSLNAPQEQDEDEDRTQEPIENDFYDVLRLQSHFEDWDDEDQKDWNKQSQIVLTLLEMAGLTEMASEPGGPLRTLTSLDVKRLISALESNAFGMFDRAKKKAICFGRAIYPIASFFNHSCDCNSAAVQADGSAEEITGEAVLRLIEQEEINKKEAPQALSSLSTSGSESETGTSTPAGPGTGTATPAEEEEGSETTTLTEEVDPYASRVGEFRMMTFFSICDIPKGSLLFTLHPLVIV
ncbi:hypothetical protein KI688_000240 [Linnemannia hyalina]|uniref:SET domain-containing protein n=1 Tax=Linnemannia hyalina TaxID=64524 RepID=A0A9P7Y340_9FUNG|nr:hypothetical protein KI688_000240 [Linnemannia hyalina]